MNSMPIAARYIFIILCTCDNSRRTKTYPCLQISREVCYIWTNGWRRRQELAFRDSLTHIRWSSSIGSPQQNLASTNESRLKKIFSSLFWGQYNNLPPTISDLGTGSIPDTDPRSHLSWHFVRIQTFWKYSRLSSCNKVHSWLQVME